MTHRAPAAVVAPCCLGSSCPRRATLPGGGWACRTALETGRLADPGPAASIDRSVERIVRRSAGWSLRALLPCPACACRAYSPGPGGLPERRCWACGQEFNPEAAEVAARRAL